MIPPRIMRKIERCLALSKSANQHEAGIAIRQAQALMAEYGLTEMDVAASRLDSADVYAHCGQTPPTHLVMLVNMIDAAFCTHSVFLRQKKRSGWKMRCSFIGTHEAARIAGYAYEVLERQLIRDRRNFMQTIHGNARRTTRIRRADVYARGWVQGAYKHVVALEKSDELVKAINAYMRQIYGQLDSVESEGRDRGFGRNDDHALLEGYKAGQEVRLHGGVETPHREGITYG